MKVAIVTGGSRGIGKAIGLRLAKSDYKVILVAKNPDNLQLALEELNHQNIESYACDVSDINQVKTTVNSIYQKYSRIDLLVNSAGISQLNLLEEENYESWRNQIDINLSGTFYFCREAFLKMKEANYGRIINISSVYGLIGGECYSAYCASKHGVVGLTKSLALEMAKYNITVNAICPGWVETDMFESDMTEISNAYNIDRETLISEEKIAIPLKNLIQSEEVAELALYLSSNSAKNITGQAINISGGLAV